MTNIYSNLTGFNETFSEQQIREISESIIKAVQDEIEEQYQSINNSLINEGMQNPKQIPSKNYYDM